MCVYIYIYIYIHVYIYIYICHACTPTVCISPGASGSCFPRRPASARADSSPPPAEGDHYRNHSLVYYH